MSNKIKRNAIKAASVGMAAMMAATPLTAFAAEETPVEGANSVEATKLVALEGTSETYRAEGATKVAEAATKDANEKLEVAGNELQKAAGTTNPKTEVNAGEAALADVATQLDNIKNANADVVKNEGLNDTAAGGAKTVASDEKAAAQTSADEFNGHADAVATAGTEAEARAQYDAAAKAAETAQNDYNNASARLEELKGQIETTDKVVASAQARYDAAVEKADEDVAKAEEELAAAKKLATDLQTAANAEREKLAQSAAARIVAEQEARNAHVGENGKVKSGESQAFWTDNDTLFYDIIQNYYVPVVKNAKFVSADEKFTRPRANEVGATRAHDENGNYYKVVCEIDGEQQTLYMNYKVEGNKLVIFEKVFVNEDIYYYKDAKGTMHDVDTTASNVVTINSAKYLLNDNGTERDVVEVGETSDDGATVVTGITKNAEHTYEVDKDGNVVEVTTGTVTKVTTTGKTLSGGTAHYESEAEAKAAAELKRQGLKNGLGDNEAVEFQNGVSATETAAVTHEEDVFRDKYDATATYVPQFVATITQDWDDSFGEIHSVVIEKAVEDALKKVTDLGYHVAEMAYTENVTWKSWAGTMSKGNVVVSITFAKATEKREEDVNFNFFKNFSYDEQRKAEATLEKELGPGCLDTDIIKGGWNLDFLTADFRVYMGVQDTATSTSYVSAADAEAKAAKSAEDKMAAEAERIAAQLKTAVRGEMRTGTASYKTNATKEKNGTRTVVDQEAYWTIDDADYTLATTTTKQNQRVTEKVYDTQDLTKLHVEGYYGNDNYGAHKDLFFEATDTGFNNFLNDYKQNKQNADNIAQKAQDAVTAYGEAQKKVETLKNELASLKSSSVAGDDIARAEEKARIESELTAAELDLEAAKANVDAIVSRMAGLATVLENRIAFLTPAPAAPAAPAAVGGAVAVDANVAAAPARLVRVNPVAAPLANNTLDNGDDAAEEDVNLQQVVNSNDVTTALSDMTLEDDAKANTILGWWWLLIVAVLGGTGYTMYRKFQQKKVAEKIDKTK